MATRPTKQKLTKTANNFLNQIVSRTQKKHRSPSDANSGSLQYQAILLPLDSLGCDHLEIERGRESSESNSRDESRSTPEMSSVDKLFTRKHV